MPQDSAKPLTYSRYLCVDELLAQQRPLSDGPEHDEMLFIIIHQVYELWFKQLLHELNALTQSLDGGETVAALATLKRMLTIMKTLVSQVDILETMTPLSFNAFRSRLDASSGFQSGQFREFEFRLGYKRRPMIDHHPEDSAARVRLEQAYRSPGLYDHFLRYLHVLGEPVPQSLLERDITAAYEPSQSVQQILVDLYRRADFAAQVCERMVDLDEGLQEWRYRHVKMVERTIGTKSGTGGSAGADYLRATLFKPLFPDLWAIRAQL